MRDPASSPLRAELAALDPTLRATLDDHGFAIDRFLALVDQLRAGALTPGSGRLTGSVTPPRSDELTSLPAPGSAARARLEARGRQAIARGEVGACILAGGMATRFGGLVKAAVEVTGGRSFLDLKLADLARLGAQLGVTIPALVMTSVATDAPVAALVAGARAVTVFSQSVALRVTPEGDLFYEPDGQPSLYAPGHGDLTDALRRSGALAEFLAAGGRHLLMSNVDNLAATLEPAVIGAHLEAVDAGAAMTVEVVDKAPGDRGGAPARVDGRLRIVEAFLFPEDVDQDRFTVFNTNTFVLDARAIDRDFPLPYHAVVKTVDERPTVQFERLVGELTVSLPARFLRVAREGPDGRFLPIKEPEDLERSRAALAELLAARGLL
ncbi:MAG: UTP--glucose-1-phosphate uridylyltransferase [Nannocystaceae bacterium]